MSLSWSLSTPSSTSRPAGLAAAGEPGGRARAEVGGVADEHGGAGVRLGGLEGVDRPHHLDLDALLAQHLGQGPGPLRAGALGVEVGGGPLRREGEQHHEQQAEGDHADEGPRCAARVAGPSAGRPAAAVAVVERGAHRGPAAVAGSGSTGRVRGEVGVERDDVTGRLGAGGAPAVAHGVEGVGRDGEGRGGCREHRSQRDRHLVRGAAREVVEQGALDGRPGDRPVGLQHGGVGVAGVEGAGGRGPVLGSGAGGPVEHAVAAGGRSSGARRAASAPRTRATTAATMTATATQIVQPASAAPRRCRTAAGSASPGAAPAGPSARGRSPCAARPRATAAPRGDVGSSGGSSRTGSAGPGGARPRGGSALLGRVDELHVEALAPDPLVDRHQGVDPGRERGGDRPADQGGRAR